MHLISQKIEEIKRSIRLYVLFDGVARATGVFLIGVWLVVLLDYLPIRFGFVELPWHPRATAMLIVAAISAAVLQSQLFKRLFKPLSDESICLLIEKRYPEFDDRLLNHSLGPDTYSDRHNSLVAESIHQAAQHIHKVRPSELFAFGPLARSVCLFLLPLVAFLILLATLPQWTVNGLGRSLLLTNEPYARQTVLSDFRFRVVNEKHVIAKMFPAESISFSTTSQTILPQNSRIELTIDALAEDQGRRLTIPRSCKLRYRLADGRNGTIDFVKFKKEADGKTSFVCRGGFLTAVDAPGRFWIHAHDATEGPFEFDVVNPPSPVTISTDSVYPKYLSDSSSIWESATQSFVNNSPVPQNTRVTFNVRYNKRDLSQAKVWNRSNGEFIEPNPLKLREGIVSFEYFATQTTDLQLAAMDRHGIASAQATQFTIPVIEDRPPELNIKRNGVGFSVTRNAIIRLTIEATDEFGIQSGQITCQLTSGGRFDEPFKWDADESKELTIDLLELRRSGKLEINSEDLDKDLKMTIRTLLSDFCPQNPPAIGQVYEFNVVTESRFVQLIETEEAGFRQQLEDIHTEFESAKNVFGSAIRLCEAPPKEDDQSIQKLRESARVYLQQVRLQTQKSSQDIVSIANAFDRMIEQIINNRLSINTKRRGLEQDIAKPLRQFSTRTMAEFLNNIVNCGSLIESIDDSPSKIAVLQQVKNLSARHTELVAELDAIIQKMVKYESQAELLDSIRNLMDDQKELSAETQKERDRILFDGLLD